METTKVMKVSVKNQDRITIYELHNIEKVEEFMYLKTKMCKEGADVKDLRNRP